MSVPGRPQAHPSQPQPFPYPQSSTPVTPAGGSEASSVSWHSLRYRSQRWYSSPAVCPSEPAYKKREGRTTPTHPHLGPRLDPSSKAARSLRARDTLEGLEATVLFCSGVSGGLETSFKS